MHYMGLVTDEELPIDNIDEALNCIRLGQYWNTGDESFSLAKEFGLAPMDKIRGLLQVVPMG